MEKALKNRFPTIRIQLAGLWVCGGWCHYAIKVTDHSSLIGPPVYRQNV